MLGFVQFEILIKGGSKLEQFRSLKNRICILALHL